MGAYVTLRNLVLILSLPAAAEKAVVSSDGHSLFHSVKHDKKDLKPTSAVVRGATDAADTDVGQAAEPNVRIEAGEDAGSLAETGMELTAGMQLGMVTLIEELDGSAYQLAQMPTRASGDEGKTIGSGTYGAVWKGRMAGRIELVAVKVFHNNKKPDDDESTGCAYQNLMRRKAALLGKSLCVPACIQDCSHAMDISLPPAATEQCDRTKFYLVMDLAPGVSLKSTLRGKADAPLSMANLRDRLFNAALRKKVAAQLLECVDLLGIEAKEPVGGLLTEPTDLPVIIHRDLKPDNFHVAATGETSADLEVDLTMLDLGLALPIVATWTFHHIAGKDGKELNANNQWVWTTTENGHKKGRYAPVPIFDVHESTALTLDGHYWVCRAWSCENEVTLNCNLIAGDTSIPNAGTDRCVFNLAYVATSGGAPVISRDTRKQVGTIFRNAVSWGQARDLGQLSHHGPFYHFGYPTAPPAVCFTPVQADLDGDVSGFDVYSVGATDYLIWCVQYHFVKDFDWCEQRLMSYIFEAENNRNNGGRENIFDASNPATWPIGTFLRTTLPRATYAHGYPGGPTDVRFLGYDYDSRECIIVATLCLELPRRGEGCVRGSAQMTKRTYRTPCQHRQHVFALEKGDVTKGFRAALETNGESIEDLWNEVRTFDTRFSMTPRALSTGSSSSAPRPSAADLLKSLTTPQVKAPDASHVVAPARERAEGVRGSTAVRARASTAVWGQRHGAVSQLTQPDPRAGSRAVRPLSHAVRRLSHM